MQGPETSPTDRGTQVPAPAWTGDDREVAKDEELSRPVGCAPWRHRRVLHGGEGRASVPRWRPPPPRWLLRPPPGGAPFLSPLHPGSRPRAPAL